MVDGTLHQAHLSRPVGIDHFSCSWIKHRECAWQPRKSVADSIKKTCLLLYTRCPIVTCPCKVVPCLPGTFQLKQRTFCFCKRNYVAFSKVFHIWTNFDSSTHFPGSIFALRTCCTQKYHWVARWRNIISRNVNPFESMYEGLVCKAEGVCLKLVTTGIVWLPVAVLRVVRRVVFLQLWFAVRAFFARIWEVWITWWLIALYLTDCTLQVCAVSGEVMNFELISPCYFFITDCGQ